MCASRASASFHRSRPRSRGEVPPQAPRRAARADWTARSTSAALAEATSQRGSSVAGFSVTKTRPPSGSTQSPSIHSLEGGNRTAACAAATTPVAISGSLERRLALGHVGVEPLAGVLALEQLLLELALDGEAALERHLGAGLHRPLDPADRLGGRIRRAELAGEVVDLAQEVVALEDVVDDPDLLRLLEVDEPAGDHQVDRQVLADAAGQPLGAAGAGEHAQVDLGQAGLAGALLGNQDVGGHGDLEPAADRVPFERREDQLGGLLQAVQGLVGVQTEVVLEVGVGPLEHVDVGAGAEEFLALAGEDDDMDLAVEARLDDRLVDLAHHLVGIGIGRRIVEGEIGDPLLDLVVDQGALLGGRFRGDWLSHMTLLSSGY